MLTNASIFAKKEMEKVSLTITLFLFKTDRLTSNKPTQASSIDRLPPVTCISIKLLLYDVRGQT